ALGAICETATAKKIIQCLFAIVYHHHFVDQTVLGQCLQCHLYILRTILGEEDAFGFAHMLRRRSFDSIRKFVEAARMDMRKRKSSVQSLGQRIGAEGTPS